MLAQPPRYPKRLAFFGTPQVATVVLRALHDAGFQIALVVTRPDKRRGRGSEVSPSPVKTVAAELGLPVSHDVDDVLAAGVDLAVVVAYGRLIKRHVLEAVPMVNLHFSLLPRWRGAAPVERAVLAGDATTGVCVMALEEGLDTGPIYRQAEYALDDEESVDSVRDHLAQMGTGLLLAMLRDGIPAAVPQAGEATHAAKIDQAELRLDFAQPAAQLCRVVRLGDAWCTFRGKRLKVWRAAAAGGPPAAPGTFDGDRVACGEGWLVLKEVQPEGKGRVSVAAWLNGARPQPGEALQ